MESQDYLKNPEQSSPESIGILITEVEDLIAGWPHNQSDKYYQILERLIRGYRLKPIREKFDIFMVEKLIRQVGDNFGVSDLFLRFGQWLEFIGDFEGAVYIYSQGVRIESGLKDLDWYNHNNLGYSLNQVGRYEEAEGFCRKAIEIDPDRHNSYKNLGVSLEGQGHFTEAATLYIKATMMSPGDPRALNHLEALVAKHGEIQMELKDLNNQLETCRQAVAAANPPSQPVKGKKRK